MNQKLQTEGFGIPEDKKNTPEAVKAYKQVLKKMKHKDIYRIAQYNYGFKMFIQQLDCISDELLDYLEELNRHTFLIVEYGIESANDDTLKRINRGHTFECSRRAVEKTHERGILVGGHIILGLPGEDREECLRQAPIISALPLDILKIHQMQIICNTPLAEQYMQNPFHVFSVEEYVELVVDYISLLRKDLVLERFVSQSPADLLIAPKWGLKNHEFTALVRKALRGKR